MPTLKVMALACRDDLRPLLDAGLIGQASAGQAFAVERTWLKNDHNKKCKPLLNVSYDTQAFLFEDGSFYVDGGADGRAEFDDFAGTAESGDLCHAAMLFVGPHAAKSGVLTAIDRVRERCPGIAFMVFMLSSDSWEVLNYIAGKGNPHYAIPQGTRLLSEWEGQWTEGFRWCAEALKGIKESLVEGPILGVGCLLVACEEGTFFLSKREWKNGDQKYGTFGGPLDSDANITGVILRHGKERFHLDDESVFTPGPLLACTNMRRGGKNHYVDMTFLFTVQRESRLRRGDDFDWYDVAQMEEFWREGKLYLPVANAFLRYCALEAYGRLGSALLLPAAISWIQPHFTHSVALPTDKLLDIAKLLGPQTNGEGSAAGVGGCPELWPLFFETP
ncbi:hypothetical protein AB0Q95_37425 [Streptomyces sp. NPDC059900]|uniref:hypothetical protein n=1 Tax=Streptomyces sp. NPDC059900 TaxID=3155816 RepID=UPI003421D3F4